MSRLIPIVGELISRGLPCLVSIDQSLIDSFEGMSEMEIFVFCRFTALFHKAMAIKKALTFVICSMLILGATGRIERPRGVAISSKYSCCSAPKTRCKCLRAPLKTPNYRLYRVLLVIYTYCCFSHLVVSWRY